MLGCYHPQMTPDRWSVVAVWLGNLLKQDPICFDRLTWQGPGGGEWASGRKSCHPVESSFHCGAPHEQRGAVFDLLMKTLQLLC